MGQIALHDDHKSFVIASKFCLEESRDGALSLYVISARFKLKEELI